jgi:hypothetical protein
MQYCRLDSFVVASGFAAIGVGIKNYTGVRMFRLMKTARFIPGMSTLINSLYFSMSGLLHVGLLTLTVLLAFSMFGLTLWNGIMMGQCAYIPEDGTLPQ